MNLSKALKRDRVRSKKMKINLFDDDYSTDEKPKKRKKIKKVKKENADI